MGTSITPRGTLIYKEPTEDAETDDENWETIEADELTEGPHVEWAKPTYKGDSTEYQVVFTKNSPVGRFEWAVTYSMGSNGMTIDDSVLTAPKGVEYEDHIEFTTK
ncbi:hypothetical protein ACIPIX_27065 [Pseudomonas protegens]|uniref:hypothetical protein n=1 Tax=Pseudomonas protegens TaxID=380021 RepID=UPI0038182EDC